MPPISLWQEIHRQKSLFALKKRRYITKFLGVCILIVIIGIENGPHIGHSAYAQLNTPLNHTNPSVNYNCRQVSFSPDGNPYGLCPGSFPRGGNCVWWPWEQWHLLGYDLPRNWGNAADWIADAERSGLPLGKTPRVGSIAVFPIGDGVWAYGTTGHVAFVTSVSTDNSTFDVTYQNYGDPTPMYIGRNYSVSVINEPRFQNGNLRFIYFPKTLEPRRFAQLQGLNSNVNITGIAQANSSLMSSFDGTTSNSVASNQIALGLPPSSSEQEYNADFTGVGLSNLLLYNRPKGSLSVLTFTDELTNFQQRHLPRFATNEIQATQNTTTNTKPVPLEDAITPVNGWGSSLDIHIGDFTGIGRSEILLYDRVTGKLQLLSLTPSLTIQKHVVYAGYGSGFELYVGKLDGQRSDVFMYNRLVNTLPISAMSTSNTNTTIGFTPITETTPLTETKPSLTPDLSPTPKSSPTSIGIQGIKTSMFHYNGGGGPTTITGSLVDGDLSRLLSGTLRPALSANVIVLGFNQNFIIQHTQQYTLEDNSWEVYVGSFVNINRDAIFLYDRLLGEVRLLSFDNNLRVVQYKAIHNVDPNWEVHSGDFMGAGRDQVLLYNPASGDAEIWVLKSDLSIAKQQTYSNWGTNQVLYIGHFGTPMLGVMLYDPQATISTFFAFDMNLAVTHQNAVHSWDNRWQILIGSFLDRSRCLASHDCATGDDILVLNRQNGQIQQYVFSFGNQYPVDDNRSTGFVRNGVAPTEVLKSLDATTFELMATLNTTIRSEELY